MTGGGGGNCPPPPSPPDSYASATAVQLSNEFIAHPETLSKITHMFTSPEALICSRWRKLLLENDNFVKNILAIVVDEAHCIVKW